MDKLLQGYVLPPDDMMHAARQSLSPVGFQNLMAQTKGFPPTPEELCAMVDAERQASAETEH